MIDNIITRKLSNRMLMPTWTTCPIGNSSSGSAFELLKQQKTIHYMSVNSMINYTSGVSKQFITTLLRK